MNTNEEKILYRAESYEFLNCAIVPLNYHDPVWL